MAAHENLGAQFAQMTPEEYEASAGEGRRWVYHATNDPERFAEGVKMANVPNNLTRQRYEAGEYAEFQPGAGAGRGTYVGAEPHVVSGFGRHLFAFSVPTEHLQRPPETEEGKEDIEQHLRWENGALLTHDVAPEHVVHVGRVLSSSGTGLEHHQMNALARGEHVPEEHWGEIVKGRFRHAARLAATVMAGGQWAAR